MAGYIDSFRMMRTQHLRFGATVVIPGYKLRPEDQLRLVRRRRDLVRDVAGRISQLLTSPFRDMRFRLFRNSRFLLPLASVVMVLAPSVTQATTRVVTSLADSGTGTLREAIGASDNGDVITFSVTGVMGLTSGQLLITKSITVTGPGATQLEITRVGADHRIFAIFSGSSFVPIVTI